MRLRGSSAGSEDPCPECWNGTLSTIVASESFEVEGQRVQVDGLLPLQCSDCRVLIWPNAEVQRARRIIDLMLCKKAA
ncbi:MAG: hypothetical protein HY814_05720 [Candidatus Riflebacteria bacterium]|nr:hypothetical protein [Candidatus Riflebacteria bacterium]